MLLRMLVDTNDLIDSHEVADLLRLASHRSVSTYRGRYPDFPEPVIEKSGGRCVLWLRGEIDAWASRHGRSGDARR